MIGKYKNITNICVIAISFLLNGCALLLPASVATTGAIISDERSMGSIIDDRLIVTKIKAVISEYGSGYILMHTHIDVFEGRVLLTGSVPSQEYANSIVKDTWGIKGVKEVINELDVDMKHIRETAKDSWIANAIGGRMFLEKNFRSTNYIIAVNNSNVYLLGIAYDQDEMDRALIIASSVAGVKKVMNYVILRDDPRRSLN